MRLAVVVTLLFACSHPAEDAPISCREPPMPTDQWRAAVGKVLPPGAAITRVSRGVPDGWVSDVAGIRLDGAAFTVWVLPRDWIGIRTHHDDHANAWDGILANAEAVTITAATDPAIPQAMRALDMSTPSLVNGGWFAANKFWTGRLDEAKVAKLVADHCPDQAARDEAASSLIVLGVPAAGVIRDAAVNAVSRDAQSFAISALANLPGADTDRALVTILADRATGDAQRGYAAQAAAQLAGNFGPALATALPLATSSDTRTKIIRALARLRYTDAAPAILAAMRADTNPYTKTEYGTALATLRHAPAIAELTAVISAPFPPTVTFSPQSETDIRERARRALFVLTGTWGAPAGGRRLAIVPASGTHVTLYAENVGDADLSYFDTVLGTWTIDGTDLPRTPTDIDGIDSFPPTAVAATDEDLPLARGTHRVHYTAGGAVSNELTITVN